MVAFYFLAFDTSALYSLGKTTKKLKTRSTTKPSLACAGDENKHHVSLFSMSWYQLDVLMATIIL